MPINFIEPAKELEPVTIVNHEFTRQDYEDFVFSLEKGDIFYYDPKYTNLNNVLEQINLYKDQHIVPNGHTYYFDVKPALPGDILFAIHGHAAIAVLRNESVNNTPIGG